MTDRFPALSAAVIASHFENGTPASSAYVLMAQPIRDGAPPFCLSLFGTDNRFTSQNVFKRWQYIDEGLANVGVEVWGFSADGDPKLLRAMKQHMFGNTGLPENIPFSWSTSWFFGAEEQRFTVIQDTIHTANNFRTRMNPSVLLAIGNYVVSSSHLRLLMETRSKEEHGLSDYCLSNEDKQNFDVSLRICQEKVTDLLQQYVVGSEGTVAYLTVMRYSIEACLVKAASPLERLYKIWYCVFFLRFRKLWLEEHPKYSMRNFITSNLFLCVEVTAHGMLVLVRKCRLQSSPELLLMHLFSRQGCETSSCSKCRRLTDNSSS